MSQIEVRLVEQAELPLLARHGHLFYAEAPSLPGDYSQEQFMKIWTGVLRSKLGIVLGAFDDDDEVCGAIMGILYQDMHSDALVLTEAAWFVLPDARGKGVGSQLLGEFENWGRMAGAHYVRMAHLANSMPEELKTFYEAKGYSVLEVAYQKPICAN